LGNSWKSKIVLSLLVISVVTQLPTVRGQTAAHLTMSFTGQNVTAGFNSTVTIAVLNNWIGYSSIYNAIYDVDISVSFPSSSPLTIYGDNHWHFDSILFGQTVTLTFKVYAPLTTTPTVPNAYIGSVSATYKQLGNTAYTTDTHDLTIAVSGWINLVLYGTLALPPTATPGGNTTVSGNILNSGNLAAFNVNVSVVSPILAPDIPASAFIGEVDPNIPRPFSMLIVFKQNVPVGNYSLTFLVTGFDQSRPGQPVIGRETIPMQISRPVQRQVISRQGFGSGPFATVLEVLLYVFDIFFGSTAMLCTYFNALHRSF